MVIVNKMRIHRGKTEDITIFNKILQFLTPKFNFVVCSIQEAKDVEELSIDELQGSLLVHGQNFLQQELEEKAMKALTADRFLSAMRMNSGRSKGRGTNDRCYFN